jgi:diacylglycerol kinase
MKRSFIKSLSWAVKGVSTGLKRERNLNIHFWFAIVVLFIAYMLKVEAEDFVFLLSAIFFVIISEVANTIIEYAMDVLYPHYNPKVGMIKDLSAGIVFLAAIYSIVVGGIVFGKYIGLPYHYWWPLIMMLIFVVIYFSLRFRR